jgi:DNA-binding NtrC family response regulator
MKKRILLAEDDDPVRKMVGRVLESENYEVQLARTAGSEFTSAVSKAPDLILLDIDCAGAQGGNALETINTITPSVPVIVFAASAKVLSTAACARVNAWLEKPLDLVKLLKTISHTLSECDPAGERQGQAAAGAYGLNYPAATSAR